MLRFGDGTPFPLDESFLEVLVNAVGACTAMLTATAQLEDRQARARQKQRELLEERRSLERFEQTVRVAAAESVPANRPTSMPTELAFQQTIAAMQHALKHAHEQLEQSAAANVAEFGQGEAARQVEFAVGRFFECHMLPGSTWSWSWDATPERPSFEATARGARFAVSFELEPDAIWRAPIRIATIAPGIVLELPRRRWLRKPAITPMLLDRYVLVGARCDPEGWRFDIQERAGAAPGWLITLPREGDGSATALDRRGRAIATSPVALSQLGPLIDAIDHQLRARLCARRVRTILLGGVAVAQLDDTTTAARALLDEIGPIVREIRSRSLVPGELSLKRDVAAGVREELFVSRTQLAACYASLPPQYRHLLDAIGVGRGITEVQGEGNTDATVMAPPHAAEPLIPQHTSTHPPPIPRRSSAHIPTTPVKSLRAIPIQSSDATPMFRIPLRPSTSAA